MTSVHIPRKLINKVLEQSQQSPDKEICGLISSINNLPTNCYPVTNTSVEPGHRYLMDPQQQIDAFRIMRKRGEKLFAIYHSHPESPASPSAEDLRQASYPEALNIIISMSTTGTLQLRGFRFKADSTSAVDIVVE